MLFLALGLGLALIATQFLGGDEEDGGEGAEENGFERTDEGYVGGDGDDTILNSDLSEDDHFSIRNFFGGAGNDLIDTFAEGVDPHSANAFDGYSSASAYGGEGDDTIRGEFQELVDGGPGNDFLQVAEAGTSPVSVYGGLGDDTIDARNFENGLIWGDEGDDDITISSRGPEGTAFAVRADGGDGDDTLTAIGYSQSHDPIFVDTSYPSILLGGAGDDSFNVVITPGLQESEFDHERGGEYLDSRGPLVSDDIAVISDFERGTETINLTVEAENGAISLDHIRMEEEETYSSNTFLRGPGTQIIVHYTVADGPARELVIHINGTGLTWDDVTLVGASRDVLVPLAA